MLTRPPVLQVVSLETINRCNRQCWFCKFGQDQPNTRTHYLSTALYTRLLDELRLGGFTGRLALYGINEPLLDRRLLDWYTQARELLPTVTLSLLTNGDLLTEAICDFCQTLNIRLGISVYDEQTWTKATALAAYYPIHLLDRRTTTFISNRAGAIVDLNLRLGPGPTPYQQARPLQANCQRPSTLLQVLPTGQVVLCCCDFYAEEIVGDLHTQPIAEIWYGRQLTAIRDRLQQGRHGLKLCEQCDHDGSGHPVAFP